MSHKLWNYWQWIVSEPSVNDSEQLVNRQWIQRLISEQLVNDSEQLLNGQEYSDVLSIFVMVDS